VKVGRNFINYFLQGLKQVVQSKEEDLQQRELLHNKQMAELNEANQELQQRFDKVIVIYTFFHPNICSEYSASSSRH
jgi:predicted alpha/beta-fold hydrolase